MSLAQTLGKYEIRGTLGRGAMGIVYDGFDPVIARRVAIKTVPLPADPDPETADEIARFRREAQAAGRLAHPNIVAVFDYGETADIAFIVMEFVDGPTLKSVLDRHERFAVADIQHVMDGLLAGLQFSHERGVVHRDIKPANVMLTSDGRAKITDFGIARIEMSSMTQAGTVMGTPAYMSPEQFMGQVVDARTDVYSAGVVLYQMLTGERPFEGGLTAIMHKALNTEPPVPSQLAVTAPRAMDAVVRRAMAKRPEDRYANAAAFAMAIRDALTVPPGDEEAEADATVVRGAAKSAAARPVPAPPAQQSASPPPPAKASRTPMLVGAVAVVLAVLAAGGWFLLRPAPMLLAPAEVTAVATPEPEPRPASTGTDAVPTGSAPTQAGAPPSGPAALPPPAPSAPRPTLPTAPPAPIVVAAQPPTPRPAVAPVAKPVGISAEPAPTRVTPALPPVETRTNPAASPPTRIASAPEIAPPQAPPAVAKPQPSLPAASVATPEQSNLPASAPRVQEAAVPPRPAGGGPAPLPMPTIMPPPRTVDTAAAPDSPAPAAAAPGDPTMLASAAPPALVRQQVAHALSLARCTLAGAALQDSGKLSVTGFVGSGAEPTLHQNVAALAGALPLDWRVQAVDPKFCDALAALRPVHPMGGAQGQGLTIELADNRTALRDGEPIRPRVTMADFTGDLRVDYVAHDGSLVHLFPTLADPSQKVQAQLARHLAPGERLALGDFGPGRPVWEVGPPYGTDMIIAVASSAPLRVTAPHNAEDDGTGYLAELRAAIMQARQSGAHVTGTLVLVDTLPK